MKSPKTDTVAAEMIETILSMSDWTAKNNVYKERDGDRQWKKK